MGKSTSRTSATPPLRGAGGLAGRRGGVWRAGLGLGLAAGASWVGASDSAFSGSREGRRRTLSIGSRSATRVSMPGPGHTRAEALHTAGYSDTLWYANGER